MKWSVMIGQWIPIAVVKKEEDQVFKLIDEYCAQISPLQDLRSFIEIFPKEEDGKIRYNDFIDWLYSVEFGDQAIRFVFCGM